MMGVITSNLWTPNENCRLAHQTKEKLPASSQELPTDRRGQTTQKWLTRTTTTRTTHLKPVSMWTTQPLLIPMPVTKLDLGQANQLSPRGYSERGSPPEPMSFERRGSKTGKKRSPTWIQMPGLTARTLGKSSTVDALLGFLSKSLATQLGSSNISRPVG